ncbi:hypothetical protein [Streptomyces sp. NPDC048737]|uniref:hypothetical protein n=1 Tax=unclassified Streptomyces TaxID=2593676 RepID=UPI00342DCD60
MTFGDWSLAVGSGMTNTTGTVTVVPGENGEPRIGLDYQVNVWDRCNWDPGRDGTRTDPGRNGDAR